MNARNKLFVFLSVLIFSIQGVFAQNAVQDAFKKITPLFKETAVLDGLAVIFIFGGFYALYFTLLNFFVQRIQGGKRIRITLAVIFTFFSAGTLIYAFLQGNSGSLFLSVGSWLALLVLIPGFFAFVYRYTKWIWGLEMSKAFKFFFVFAGLASVDYLFTNALIWLSKHASVGGLTGKIIQSLMDWNSEIYDWLSFIFVITLVVALIYIIQQGFKGVGVAGGKNDSPEQKNRRQMKNYLLNIKKDVNDAEERMKLLSENLKKIIRITEGLKVDLGTGYPKEVYNPGVKK